MNAQLKTARCATCEHALVSGVACDSGPADCPLLDTFKRHQSRRLHSLQLRLVTKDMAIPGEYDAVRGID